MTRTSTRPAIDPGNEPEGQEISDFMGSLQDMGECKVRVMRSHPTTGRYAWIAEFPVDEFDISTVAQQHGSGRYRFQLIDPAQRNKITASTTFDIDAPAARQRMAAPMFQPRQAPGLGGGYDQGSGDLMLERMRWELERTTEELQRLRNGGAGGAGGGMTVKDLVTSLPALITAFASLKGDSVGMKEIMAMQNKTPFDDLVSGVETIRKLAREEGGGSGGVGGGTDWAPLISVLAPIAKQFVEVIAQQQQNQNLSPPGAGARVGVGNGANQLPAMSGRQAVPSPVNAADMASAGRTPSAGQPGGIPGGNVNNGVAGSVGAASDPEARAFNRAVGLLKLGAESPNSDPDDYAGVVLDALEVARVDVTTLFTRPPLEVINELATRYPALVEQLAGHDEFVGNVLVAIQQRLSEAPIEAVEEDLGTTGQEGGDDEGK